MVISFFQLSVVVWISIGIMYLIAYCSSLWKVFKRHRAARAIPTIAYHPESDCGEGVECAICLEDIKQNELVKILPCKHIFHDHCVKGWVVNIRGICPLCRQGIFPKNDDVNDVLMCYM